MTVPFEAFMPDHPDHIWWFGQTGKCLAQPTCPHHPTEEQAMQELLEFTQELGLYDNDDT